MTITNDEHEPSTINYQLILNLRTFKPSYFETFNQLDYDHDYEARLRLRITSTKSEVQSPMSASELRSSP